MLELKDIINKVHCSDCLEFMRQMPDECIDLVLTSPPYDSLREYNGFSFRFEPIADELIRVIKPGRVIVWVVGDSTINGSESGTSFKQALYFKEHGLSIHDTMIYEKAGPAYPSKDKYYQVFEYMFVLSKGKPLVFNPIKDRLNRWYGEKWSKIRTRRQKNGELTATTWNKDEGGQYGIRFNIWRYAVGAGNGGDGLSFEHPASFPEGLARDHILSWSNPGEVILDPLMGGGTTCKMAKATGRKFIGIDVSEKYTKIAKERLRQEYLI